MADDSSELDELVQAASWHSPATTIPTTKNNSTANTTTNSNAPTKTNNNDNPNTKTTADNQNIDIGNTSSASGKVAPSSNPLFDDSTTNGFTTAPATSEDDYESDDDDDDSRSNYSNNNTSNSNSMISNSARKHGGKNAMVKGEEKRSHHNVLERKRRDLLKDSFSRLRDSVPTTQPRDRVSRAEILKQAADYIASTVQRNAAARAELDELIRKNRQLEEQKKAGGVVSSGSVATTSVKSGDAKKMLLVSGTQELVVKHEH